MALVAVLAVAVVGTGHAKDNAEATVEVRVWQHVEDPDDIHVSARPAGGAWRTLGTIPLPLDDGISAAGDRFGGFAVDVPQVEWAVPRSVQVRVWQNVQMGSEISIEARPENGLWSTLGRLPLPLDDGISSSGRYRYGDILFTVSLPQERVWTLAGRADEAGYVDGSREEARLSGILGLEVDRDGSILFVDDSGAIRRIGLDGSVAMIAGGPASSCGHQDGPVAVATFCRPRDIAVAEDGTVYVADSRSGLRKITLDGTVLTIEGSPFAGGIVRASEDFDPGVPAPVSVSGVAFDGAGNLYVLEQRGNEFDGVWGPSIIRYSPSGDVVTVREEVSDLGNIVGFDVDDAGNVYMLHAAYAVAVVTKVDGDGNLSVLHRGGHPARGGLLASPGGLAVAGDGAIYLANTGRSQIVRLTPGGDFVAIAGTGDDGHVDGPAGESLFRLPRGLGVSPDGALIVVDQFSRVVRVIDPGAGGFWEGGVELASHVELPRVTGVSASVYAGGSWGRWYQDGPAEQARFHWPEGMAWDAEGGVIVADSGNHAIRRISPDGVVTTVAGGNGQGDLDGPGREAQFDRPSGVAVDVDGTIYVTAFRFVRRVAPDGTVTTVEASGSERLRILGPLALAPDGRSLLLYEGADGLVSLSPDGKPSVIAGVGSVDAIAVDYDGNIYVVGARWPMTTIWKIAGNGDVTRVFEDRAGRYGGVFSDVVNGLVVAPDGFLYAADRGFGRLVRVSPDGQVAIVVESVMLEGPGSFRPWGVLVTAEGNLLVADSEQNLIWKVVLPDEEDD